MILNSGESFPKPILPPNDKKAKLFIWIVSIIVFLGIAALSRIKLDINVEYMWEDVLKPTETYKF